MDINKKINEITDKIIDDKLPEMAEKHVTSMLNEIMSDIFRSHSDTAKAIKKKIEEKLDVNLQKFDLIDYNALIAKAINDSIVQQVNIQPIMDLTRDAVGFINKKSITLTEIAHMIKNAAMEDSNDNDGNISMFVSRNSVYKWVEVYVDIEEKKAAKDCGLHFIFNEKENRGYIFSFHTSDYWSGRGPITPARIASLSSIEHKIFRLYSAQVEIVADDDDIDTYWSRND